MIKNITKIGMLIALSVVGSIIKIPGTSVALDSFPGYFASIFLSPLAGGIVGLFGHLASAIYSGFPLTALTHSIIALEMFVFIFLFGHIQRKTNDFIAIIIGTILNGVISPILLSPIITFKGALAFIPFLSLVSFCNIIIGVVIYKALKIRKGVF